MLKTSIDNGSWLICAEGLNCRVIINLFIHMLACLSELTLRIPVLVYPQPPSREAAHYVVSVLRYRLEQQTA